MAARRHPASSPDDPDEDEAIRLMAEILEDDGSVPREAFEVLKRDHPRLAGRLDDIYGGLQFFVRFREDLRRARYRGPLPARDPAAAVGPGREAARPSVARAPSSRRSAVLGYAAAILLLVAGAWFLRSRERVGGDGASPDADVLAATADLLLRIAPDVLAQEKRVAETHLAALAGYVTECEAIQSSLARAAIRTPSVEQVLKRADEASRAFRSECMQAPAGSSGGRVLDYLEARRGDVSSSPELSLLFLSLLPSLPERTVALTPAAAIVLARATTDSLLSLRVIDLDAEGRELEGARVYGQPVALPSGEIGEPVFLGESPIDAVLGAGDWRLTIADPATKRHSELRLLVLPGVPLPPQVAFLRTVDPEEQRMVWMEPCTIPYGAPPDLKSLHFREAPSHVEDFWIDRCEVTNEEYAVFYRYVLEHGEALAEEFGISKPAFFDEDGGFPPEMCDHPVAGVTWEDAVRYANWAGKRLPTDREWERAAQGPEGRRYPWGDSFDPERVAISRFVLVPSADGRMLVPQDPDVNEPCKCGPVFDPRFEGGAALSEGRGRIYRLADNVSEWVEDIYARPDGRGGIGYGLADTFLRCVRGSNWLFASEFQCLADVRSGSMPSASPAVGFRCVLSSYPGFVPD
jgi:formylglycine-generating enzyme required for sulfatase activity